MAATLRWTNWAGNQTSQPRRWLRVESAKEVSEAVGEARDLEARLRVVGSGHSFTSIAVANDVLVDISALQEVGRVDPVSGEVEVGAGISIADLNAALHKQGRALANMGDIAYQTTAGAISTATHGTGVRLQGLAAQVSALTVVDGRGEIRRLSGDDAFRCAQVSLGTMGVITSVRLKTVPAFVLRAVEQPMVLEEVLEGLGEHVESNDHFEFFWIPHTKWALTKRNNRTDGPPEPMPAGKKWFQKSFLENTAFGALCRVGRIRPEWIPRLATALPSTGSTTYADHSHLIFVSERRVKFLEMEYAIPIENCAEALRRVSSMIESRGFRVSFPVEVRFTAADDIPLSTAFGRTTAYIAVHMYKGMDHAEYFRAVEEIMRSFGGRPHWGKMHFLGAEDLASCYSEWDLFQQVRRKFDPEEIFTNDYTARVLGSR